MKNSSLGKNAVLNGLKTACSIVFPFISFAYCSRILGADGIGKYSFGQSLIAYLLLLASLGIPNYAIREGAAVREKKEQLNIFINQVFTINCIMTIVAYGVLGVLFLVWPQIDEYKYIIIIQSIQIILTTLGTDWVNTIFEDYFYLALRYIIIQIIAIFLLIVFVRNSGDIYIYTFITMLANAGGNILNWFYLRNNGIIPHLVKNVDFKRHMKPILVLFCNSAATVIYLNSDIIMLGIFLTNSAVGIYTVSSKIYTMIKSLVNAIIMVTLPRFSYYLSLKQINKYRDTLEKMVEILIAIIFPAMVGLILEADKILNLVAGKGYLEGVGVVRILSIAILFAVGACFFSYSVLMPNRKEKYFLKATIIAASVNIILNIILLPVYGILAAALTTLIAEIIVFLISGYYSLKIIKININIKNVLKVIVSCFILTIICKSLDRIPLSGDVILIIEIVLGSIGYSVVLIVLGYDLLIDEIRKIMKKFKM